MIAYSDKWLKDNSGRFDPDQHCPSDFYEEAYNVMNEWHRLLSDMQDRTRLSIVAGMYHEWDKNFREWIVSEVKHWHGSDEMKAKIWKVNIGDIYVYVYYF